MFIFSFLGQQLLQSTFTNWLVIIGFIFLNMLAPDLRANTWSDPFYPIDSFWDKWAFSATLKFRPFQSSWSDITWGLIDLCIKLGGGGSPSEDKSLRQGVQTSKDTAVSYCFIHICINHKKPVVIGSIIEGFDGKI